MPSNQRIGEEEPRLNRSGTAERGTSVVVSKDMCAETNLKFLCKCVYSIFT
jgi:hypothetical protein